MGLAFIGVLFAAFLYFSANGMGQMMDIENIKYLLSRRVGGDNSLEEDCLRAINELQERLRTAEDLAEARRRGAENIINELAAAGHVGANTIGELTMQIEITKQ